MKLFRSCFLFVVIVSSAAQGAVKAATAGSAAPGAELASACTVCHGAGGHSRGAVPSLAGMKQDNFRTRMHAFRHGKGTIMGRIAPAYDDAEIAALADYFAHQPADRSHEQQAQ